MTLLFYCENVSAWYWQVLVKGVTKLHCVDEIN